MAKAHDVSEYNRKRDFKKTREPRAKKPGRGGKAKRPSFVIHEHHATRLHWDLRLERDGVLVSWAVPNGIPPDPDENRLAVHVEDHPLEYGKFEGEIPEGEYGAGKVTIWDKGTYEAEKFRDDEVMVTFHGKRLKGKYVLFQTKGDNWMIHRMDPPEFERDSMPEAPQPMLPTLRRRIPTGSEWRYELLWAGHRALFRWQPGRAKLFNEAGEAVIKQFPEIRPLGLQLGSLEAILDGELIALDDHARPSEELLEQRLATTRQAAIDRAAKSDPLIYMIYDVLYLDGRDVTGLAYVDRRKLLDDIALDGETWKTPAGHGGDGPEILAAASRAGLPGIVAKRADSVYRPGKRVLDWLYVPAD